MSIIRLAGRVLWLLVLVVVGYWAGALIATLVFVPLTQSGKLELAQIGEWGWLLSVFYYGFAAAFAWFLAGRRYWNGWKQMRLASTAD